MTATEIVGFLAGSTGIEPATPGLTGLRKVRRHPTAADKCVSLRALEGRPVGSGWAALAHTPAKFPHSQRHGNAPRNAGVTSKGAGRLHSSGRSFKYFFTTLETWPMVSRPDGQRLFSIVSWTPAT